MSPTDYFESTLSLFHSLGEYHTDMLRLAGRAIYLCTPSIELRDRLLPALEHLVDSRQIELPELTIWYADDRDLPARLKAPPWIGFNGQGYNDSIAQDDVQVFFQPWQTQLFLYSKSRRTGIYWVQRTEDVPWWECTFSFRAIFHLWTQDLPAQLVHAGAMAKNGRGVLIPGPSGSGKSTSCLNLLRAGYDYLGDDYVWVELGEQIKAFTLYQTAKVEPDNLIQRFGDWEPFITNKELYKQQKAIFNVKDLYPSAVIGESSIKGILLPRVAHQEVTLFDKANPTNALMAMAPTTLHHLPHNRVVSYHKFRSISLLLPSYHLRLGRDQKQFIESFHNFINNEISAY